MNQIKLASVATLRPGLRLASILVTLAALLGGFLVSTATLPSAPLRAPTVAAPRTPASPATATGRS